MAILSVKIEGLFQWIQFSNSDGDLSIEIPNFIASCEVLDLYNLARPGKTSTETSRSLDSTYSTTAFLSIEFLDEAHMTCKSLTSARKSPGLLLINASTAGVS